MAHKYQWFEVKRKDGLKQKCSYCGGYFDSLYIIAEDLDDANQMIEGALCEQDSSIDLIFPAWKPRQVTLIEIN